MISGSVATAAQKDLLQNDILFDIYDHHPGRGIQ